MKDRVLFTPLCELLGIEYPIILAGMGSTAGPTMAAAVSNAGGLGIVGATRLSPEEILQFIRKTRSLTNKPFGFDLVVPAMAPLSGTVEEAKAQLPAEHVAFVEKLKKELGLPEPKLKGHFLPTSMEFIRKQVEVILEERVPILASALGTPKWLADEAHAHGTKIISLAGNVKHARRIDEAGTDIIVAQGHESGGHTGRIGSLALIPQVVDAVPTKPVVAAGGIADGRGLAAALMLGAVGVWVGTAFLACDEAFVDFIELGVVNKVVADTFKRELIEATEEDTRVTKIYSGKTTRWLNNKLMERWEKEGPPTLPTPFQPLLIEDLVAALMEAGNTEYYSWAAGQIGGMIKEAKSAKKVVDDMVDGAIRILREKPAVMLQKKS